MQNELLYGKSVNDRSEKIVSIEIKDDVTELFIQDEDGSVNKKLTGNKFWILSHDNPGNWHKLEGNLYYQYGKQFTSRNDFYKTKQSLRNSDIFCINDSKEAFMVLKGYTYFRGLKPTDPSILSFDIETTGVDLNGFSKALLISNTFRKNEKKYNAEKEEWEDNLVIERKLFAYDEFTDEGEMIQEWCKWVRKMDPSIICGHNINSFDINYLKYVANKFGNKLNLGRDGSPLKTNNYESKFRKDGSQDLHYHKHSIYGREIIDTMFLAIKYDIGRKYESYGLKPIIKQEGLEVKNRQFYEASQIRNNYTNKDEWIKIKSYATHDADDSLSLYDLMSPALFYSAQMIPKSFQLICESAEGSKINSIMMRAYLQQGHSLPQKSEAEKFEGAISLGNVGIFKNVFKVDVASLYPSIMIEEKVCDHFKDPKAYFLNLVKTLTEQRLENKRKAKETGERYYKDIEQSQKILINSAYGFLAANGLLFNSPQNAAFITRKGREILQKAIDWCQNGGFKLVNADTDSISFSKIDGSFVKKEERGDLLNALNDLFPNRIKWEDDGYYRNLIVVAIKNYILLKDDFDPVKDKDFQPYTINGIVYGFKIKGSSLKDQKKELGLLEFIREIIDCILEEKHDYLKIYDKYAKEIMNLKDIKRWASKKTLTSTTYESQRANETKLIDAVKNTDYREGDKVWVYFDIDSNLKLVENYKNDHNINKLLEKLYKTSETFMDYKEKGELIQGLFRQGTFLNYSLKKNKTLLEDFK